MNDTDPSTDTRVFRVSAARRVLATGRFLVYLLVWVAPLIVLAVLVDAPLALIVTANVMLGFFALVNIVPAAIAYWRAVGAGPISIGESGIGVGDETIAWRAIRRVSLAGRNFATVVHIAWHDGRADERDIPVATLADADACMRAIADRAPGTAIAFDDDGFTYAGTRVAWDAIRRVRRRERRFLWIYYDFVGPDPESAPTVRSVVIALPLVGNRDAFLGALAERRPDERNPGEV